MLQTPTPIFVLLLLLLLRVVTADKTQLYSFAVSDSLCLALAQDAHTTTTSALPVQATWLDRAQFAHPQSHADIAVHSVYQDIVAPLLAPAGLHVAGASWAFSSAHSPSPSTSLNAPPTVHFVSVLVVDNPDSLIALATANAVALPTRNQLVLLDTDAAASALLQGHFPSLIIHWWLDKPTDVAFAARPNEFTLSAALYEHNRRPRLVDPQPQSLRVRSGQRFPDLAHLESPASNLFTTVNMEQELDLFQDTADDATFDPFNNELFGSDNTDSYESSDNKLGRQRTDSTDSASDKNDDWDSFFDDDDNDTPVTSQPQRHRPPFTRPAPPPTPLPALEVPGLHGIPRVSTKLTPHLIPSFLNGSLDTLHPYSDMVSIHVLILHSTLLEPQVNATVCCEGIWEFLALDWSSRGVHVATLDLNSHRSFLLDPSAHLFLALPSPYELAHVLIYVNATRRDNNLLIGSSPALLPSVESLLHRLVHSTPLNASALSHKATTALLSQSHLVVMGAYTNPSYVHSASLLASTHRTALFVLAHPSFLTRSLHLPHSAVTVFYYASSTARLTHQPDIDTDTPLHDWLVTHTTRFPIPFLSSFAALALRARLLFLPHHPHPARILLLPTPDDLCAPSPFLLRDAITTIPAAFIPLTAFITLYTHSSDISLLRPHSSSSTSTPASLPSALLLLYSHHLPFLDPIVTSPLVIPFSPSLSSSSCPIQSPAFSLQLNVFLASISTRLRTRTLSVQSPIFRSLATHSLEPLSTFVKSFQSDPFPLHPPLTLSTHPSALYHSIARLNSHAALLMRPLIAAETTRHLKHQQLQLQLQQHQPPSPDLTPNPNANSDSFTFTFQNSRTISAMSSSSLGYYLNDLALHSNTLCAAAHQIVLSTRTTLKQALSVSPSTNSTLLNHLNAMPACQCLYGFHTVKSVQKSLKKRSHSFARDLLELLTGTGKSLRHTIAHGTPKANRQLVQSIEKTARQLMRWRDLLNKKLAALESPLAFPPPSDIARRSLVTLSPSDFQSQFAAQSKPVLFTNSSNQWTLEHIRRLCGHTLLLPSDIVPPLTELPVDDLRLSDFLDAPRNQILDWNIQVMCPALLRPPAPSLVIPRLFSVDYAQQSAQDELTTAHATPSLYIASPNSRTPLLTAPDDTHTWILVLSGTLQYNLYDFHRRIALLTPSQDLSTLDSTPEHFLPSPTHTLTQQSHQLLYIPAGFAWSAHASDSAEPTVALRVHFANQHSLPFHLHRRLSLAATNITAPMVADSPRSLHASPLKALLDVYHAHALRNFSLSAHDLTFSQYREGEIIV